MHVLLDHIVAVLIGTVLLATLVGVQSRGRQQAAELTVSNLVKARAYQSLQLLERDIENMRNETQTAEAGLAWVCQLTLSPESLTTHFTFPTLAEPDLGPASAVAQVTYTLVTDSTYVAYNDEPVLLYRLERRINDGTGERLSGGSGAILTHFHVEAWLPAGGQVEAGACPVGVRRVHVELEAMAETVEQVTGDQRARSNVNVARLGATVYTLN